MLLFFPFLFSWLLFPQRGAGACVTCLWAKSEYTWKNRPFEPLEVWYFAQGTSTVFWRCSGTCLEPRPFPFSAQWPYRLSCHPLYDFLKLIFIFDLISPSILGSLLPIRWCNAVKGSIFNFPDLTHKSPHRPSQLKCEDCVIFRSWEGAVKALFGSPAAQLSLLPVSPAHRWRSCKKQTDSSKLLQTLFEKDFFFWPPHCNTCKYYLRTTQNTEWEVWKFFGSGTIFDIRDRWSDLNFREVYSDGFWSLAGTFSLALIAHIFSNSLFRRKTVIYCMFLSARVPKVSKLSLPAVLCARERSRTSVCWHPALLRSLLSG